MAWEQSDWLQEVASEDKGWIVVRAKWVKSAYVEGLSRGVQEAVAEILRRGGWAWLEEGECPICGGWDRVMSHEIGTPVFTFVAC